MRAQLLFILCVGVAAGASEASRGATLIYLSTRGLNEGAQPVAPQETGEFVPGRSGRFHVWVAPGAHLTGISLDVDESGGAIRFTSATVHNPAAGNGTRWLPELIRHGTVSDSRIARLEAGALVGLANSGKGIVASAGASDALYEASAGFLLATIEYAVVDAQAASNLFLSIGHNLIGDAEGRATDPIFLGPGDGPVANMSGSGGSIFDMRWTAYTPRDGDFDRDGDVDGNDFLAWESGFGTTTGGTLAQGDANVDGRVDATDLALWNSHYGFHTAAPVVSIVPEPVAFPIALGIFGAWLARRLRGH